MKRPVAFALISLMAVQVPADFVATRDLSIDAATANISSGGALLVSRTGEILVVDDKDNIFRTFSSKGATGTIGREGEGPGEFKNLRSAGWHGDSIWVYDPSLNRFSIFSPDHKFVRSFRAPAAIVDPWHPADPGLSEAYPQALLPDGSLRMLAAFRPSHAPSWGAGIDSAATLLVRVTAGGVFRNRILVVPPSPCAVTSPPWVGYLPFCLMVAATDWVTDATGMVARVEVAQGGSYRVTMVDESGTKVIDRSYTAAPVRIPKAAIDSLAALNEKRFARMGPDYLAFVRKLPVPTNYPLIRRIVVGRDNTVWLEERVATPGHTWRILDQKGNSLGKLSLPQEASLQAAELKTIWGYETDADGLQGVVRYRVNRVGP